MKNQKYVTVLFETNMYKPLGVFITIFAYATVVFVGNYLAFSIPKSTDYILESSWKCQNDNITSFDPEFCDGVDISKGNETFVGSFDEKNARRYVTLFIRPKKRNQLFGISMMVNILLDVFDENENKKERFLVSDIMRCELNKQYCNPMKLFSSYVAPYTISIRFLISSEKNVQFSNADFFYSEVGDVSVEWVYGNDNYSKFQIGYRYGHIVITISLLIWYCINLKKHRLRKTVEQKWLLAYVIFTLILDNPLYAVELVVKAYFLSIIDSFFSAFFLSFAIFYILVVLGGFITRSTSTCYFILPRLFLSFIFLVFFLLFLIFRLSVPSIASSSLNTPPCLNFTLYSTLAVFGIFLVWLFYTYVRVIVISRKHPKAIKGRYRVYVIVIMVVTVLYIGYVCVSSFFSGFDESDSTAALKNKISNYLELTSHTIVDAFGWLQMIWLCPTVSIRRTSTTLQESMAPKKKKTNSSKQGDEEEEALVLLKSE